MPILATGKPGQQGFTLLELVIVIALVAVLSASVMITLTPASDDPLQQQRLRLLQLSHKVLEQAVLYNRRVALQLRQETGISALAYHEGKWQVLEDEQFSSLPLPADLQWNLSIPGKSFSSTDLDTPVEPQILFTPDGLVSSFRLELSWPPYDDQILDDSAFYAPEISDE
ncbi:GspH/FimT family pseudopilin [Marinobacterium jannaschii]|uniref:GspH/FimT family pseudopilin n=1 Tax=Marinobacterium jannaschii TaxID=64970 RepID=UPI000488A212|nr:GspH/FimT family pseudopilin [Marinobacterium jannaschii]